MLADEEGARLSEEFAGTSPPAYCLRLKRISYPEQVQLITIHPMDYPPPPPAPIIQPASCTCSYSMNACPQHPGQSCLTPLPRVTFPPPPPQPAAKPKINSRSKGQRGEREVVHLLQDIVTRVRLSAHLDPLVLQRNALQAHLGGEDIHGLQGYAVEVKFQQNEQLPAWWRQCVAQADKVKALPILFYRGNGQKWKVKLRATVRTPKDTDDITMDVTVSLEEFAFWFECAYAEDAELEARGK